MDATTLLLGSERDPRGSLSGSKIDGQRREPQTYEAGRVCAAEDCTTVLSRYNARERCWQHELVRPYLLRAPRPTDDVGTFVDLTTLHL